MTSVLNLTELRESVDCEFKLAEGLSGTGELPKDFWKTYCAMANTNGGIVVLGVRELKDGQFKIEGIKNVEYVKKVLWDTIHNKDKISTSLLNESDLVDEVVDGKKLLVIKIPRASRNKRPVYINNNPKTGTYIRKHEGDYQCNEDEIKRMMMDSDIAHSWDSKTVHGYTIKDLDQDSLQGYKNYLKTKNPSHIFLKIDDITFLRNIGAISKTSDEITYAGLVFFGSYMALNHALPYFSLDYREIGKESNFKDARWVDRVITDGTWPGNIFSFYFKVLPKLVSNLKIPFKLDKDLFRIDDTPIHQSVREALINTLIHADHTGRVGVRIFKYPDRYEFYNFGTFLFPPQEAIKGGKSECRNPAIQKIFALLGIGEKAGSGLISILQTWQDNQWRMPLIEELFESNETRFELRMVSLYPDNVIELLQHKFRERFDNLESTEKLAVIIAESEGRVTNRRLQDLSNVHGRDLTYLLKCLVEKELLIPFENRQSRYYTVNLGDKNLSLGDKNLSLGDKNLSLRDKNLSLGDKTQNAEDISKGPNAIENSNGITNNKFLNLVKASKRVAPEIIEMAILEICDEEKTIDQISTSLGKKDKATLRKNFISKLVKEGKLELKYPNIINHPHQAYKIKKH